jgi:hypothetical protein
VSDEKKPLSKKEKFSKLAVSKSQEETKSKDAKKQLITERTAYKDTETITHAEPDVNHDTNAKTDDGTNQEVVEDVKKETEVQLFPDPVMELIHVVETGNKKKKMEELRIRSTYWLLPEERKMVNKLAKETGYVKYDVVGMAIRSMYDRVMAAKEEKKKEKKKPDQQ